MNILKNYAFTICLISGIIIGGISGIIFKESTEIVKPIGDLFLNLMFVLIVPLVFLSVSSAICNMKQTNMVGKVVTNIIVVFVFMAIISAIVAYITTLLYNPLDGINKEEFLAHLAAPEVESLSTGKVFVNTFSVSDFLKLFTKSNLLPLIIFSIMFGLGTVLAGKKGEFMANFLDSGTQVIMKMMQIVMYAAPVGLGCYFADTVGKLGGQLLQGYLQVFILYLILTVISFVIMNSIYVYLAGGKIALKSYWKHMTIPALTAIATSSSAACIPVNIEANKRMGVPANIADAVIPLGTNMHKDGSVMGGVLKIVFLITIFSQNEAIASINVFQIIGVSLLVGAVMGAIPSGGMTGELLICSVFGFSPELVGVIMVISTIIDVPATLLNSTGNVTASILVTRLTQGKDWVKNIAA